MAPCDSPLIRWERVEREMRWPSDPGAKTCFRAYGGTLLGWIIRVYKTSGTEPVAMTPLGLVLVCSLLWLLEWWYHGCPLSGYRDAITLSVAVVAVHVHFVFAAMTTWLQLDALYSNVVHIALLLGVIALYHYAPDTLIVELRAVRREMDAPLEGPPRADADDAVDDESDEDD